MSYRAPSAPEGFEHSTQEGLDIYVSRSVRLRGPALRIRLVKGWLGKRIEIEGIQLVPGGSR